jgi:hypothetical protein
LAPGNGAIEREETPWFNPIDEARKLLQGMLFCLVVEKPLNTSGRDVSAILQ